MGCTKRVSWHQRSLPCVSQKNIRTLDATPNTHTHTHTHTYNQTQASAVRGFCSYPQTTFVRPSPSRKQKDAESEQHTLFMPLSVIERSPFPKRDICSICDKKKDADVLCTHTVNDISATAGNTLDCLTISFAHIHTFLTSH